MKIKRPQHSSLASGRWREFTLMEQLANIGSEVSRALNWRGKNEEYSRMASNRALELLDLSIDDPKNSKRLGELFRIREFLADYFYFDNEYKSSEKLWRQYFDAFAYNVAINRR